MLEELTKVKEEVNFFFFAIRYEESGEPFMSLDGVRFESINQEDNTWLVAKFSNVEIKNAVWECKSNKCLL